MSVQVPRAIHVPACQSFPVNYVLLDRRPYQLALDSTTLPRRSARIRAFRHCTSPLPGEAYSHCLARTDVWARPLSVESLALLVSS
jgi:hypothetical protein